MADEVVADDPGSTGEIDAGTTPTGPAGDSTDGGTPPGDATVAAQPSEPQPASDAETQIPKYRFDEVVAQSRRHEAQVQELIAQNERSERKIRAVMGVDDPAAAGIEKPEVIQLRKDLESVYPELAWMRNNFEALQQGLPQMGQFGEHIGTFWDQQGSRAMNSVYGEASKLYFGGKELNQPQKEQLHSMYVGFVKQGNNTRRYEGNDPTLQADFFKFVEQGIVGPARRVVTKRAGSTTVPAVPQGGGASAAQGSEQPVKPKSSKEAAAAMLEHVKAQAEAKAGATQ